MTDSIERRAARWAASGDTGASSMTIYRHMMGFPHDSVFGISEPCDGHDLGRCCRLLLAVPEWAVRMPEMAVLSRAWAALVPHWSDLTGLFASEAGKAFDREARTPKTNAMIRSITAEARAADGWVTLGNGVSMKGSR